MIPLFKEILIDAPPSVVFQFLTDPAKMIRWMGISAEIDPKPGGIYRLDPNGRDVIRGEYLEVVPDSRVVFTWGWEKPSPGMPAVPAGSTQVEIDLQPENGRTRLRLSLNPKPLDEAAAWIERQRAFWTGRLDILEFRLRAEDRAAAKSRRMKRRGGRLK